MYCPALCVLCSLLSTGQDRGRNSAGPSRQCGGMWTRLASQSQTRVLPHEFSELCAEILRTRHVASHYFGPSETVTNTKTGASEGE